MQQQQCVGWCPQPALSSDPPRQYFSVFARRSLSGHAMASQWDSCGLICGTVHVKEAHIQPLGGMA